MINCRARLARLEKIVAPLTGRLIVLFGEKAKRRKAGKITDEELGLKQEDILILFNIPRPAARELFVKETAAKIPEEY